MELDVQWQMPRFPPSVAVPGTRSGNRRQTGSPRKARCDVPSERRVLRLWVLLAPLLFGELGAVALAQGSNPLFEAELLSGRFERFDPREDSGHGPMLPGSGGSPGAGGVPPRQGSGLPASGPGGTGGAGPPGSSGGGGGAGPNFPGACPPKIPGLAPGTAAWVSGSGINAAGVFDWRTAWDLYRRRIYSERLLTRGGPGQTGSSDYFLGIGRQETAVDPIPRVGDGVIEDQVAPLLLSMAHPSESNPVRLEALLALGRIADRLSGPQLDETQAALQLAIQDGSQAVSEGAVIAMGMTGDRRLAPLLVDLLRDTEVGRTASQRSPVPERLRAFAGYSLAFLARESSREDVRRYAAHHLESVLTVERGGALPDVAVAALYGLALVPVGPVDLTDPAGQPEPASASRLAGMRRVLAEFAPQGKSDDRLRDHAPAALARLVADLPAARRPELLSLAAGPIARAGRRLGSERQTFRAGLAFALGAMLTCGDGKVGEDLRELLFKLSGDPNADTRQAARLALGRVLGRGGSGPDATKNQLKLAAWLLRDLTRGRSSDRPYAALALGLAADGRRLDSLPVPAEWGLQLETQLRGTRSPEQVMALASACGLVGGSHFEETLLAAFDHAPEGEPRERIAFAMGLAGVRGAIETLEEWLPTRRGDSGALARGVEALALLGASGALTELERTLGDQPTTVEATGLLDGLGRTSDVGYVETLVECCQPGEVNLVRATAARSLGALGDRNPKPWCEDLAAVANLTAGVSTLFDFGGGGLLDLIEY